MQLSETSQAVSLLAPNAQLNALTVGIDAVLEVAVANAGNTETQATDVEETITLDTSGLSALIDISLVQIEEGVFKPWYMLDDVPPVEANNAEWDAFINTVLESYPESAREAVREEIQEYRRKSLAKLDEELPDINSSDSTSTSQNLRPAPVERGLQSTALLPLEALRGTASPWAVGGIGIDSTLWRNFSLNDS